MEEDKDFISIRKIPLKIFIESLISLYDGGANYVDIVASIKEDRDGLGLYVQEDYMLEDGEEEEDGEKGIDEDLTEEDYEKLM